MNLKLCFNILGMITLLLFLVELVLEAGMLLAVAGGTAVAIGWRSLWFNCK